MKDSGLHKKFNVRPEQLDSWAAEYESPNWDGISFGKIIQGRPRLCDEELKTLTAKVPASRIAAIQQASRKAGISKSEFVRQAIDSKLLAGG